MERERERRERPPRSKERGTQIETELQEKRDGKTNRHILRHTEIKKQRDPELQRDRQTYLYQLQTFFTSFQKLATLMRRSTVLSLPVLLVFPESPNAESYILVCPV